VVWEGWHREVSPYPDHRRILVIAGRSGEGRLTTPKPDGAEVKQNV